MIDLVKVQCNYGDGSRILSPVVDSLIITEADAVNRGYAELNKSWKIVDTYTVTMAYPADGYLLDVGKYVILTCPEVGLIGQVLYIAGIQLAGTHFGTKVTLKLERYEDFEGNASRPTPLMPFYELESETGQYWELEK